MKRRLHTILSTISLLLLIAISALWLRSHRSQDSILYRTKQQYWHLASVRGRLWLFVHEPRHRLTKMGYTSYSMSMGVGPTRSSDELAAAAYEREAALPRLHFDHYAVVAPDREIQTALDDLHLRQRDTFEAESDLAGLQSNLRIGRITDETIVHCAERPYLEAMEQQMRAWARLQAAAIPTNRGRSILGFHWHAGDGSGGAAPSPAFALPYWPLLLLAAIVPAAHLLSIHRSGNRARLALCRNCNYDLRASKDRCPECGTTITQASAR